MNTAALNDCINRHRKDAAHQGFLRELAAGIVAAGVVACLTVWLLK